MDFSLKTVYNEAFAEQALAKTQCTSAKSSSLLDPNFVDLFLPKYLVWVNTAQNLFLVTVEDFQIQCKPIIDSRTKF